MLFFNTNKPEQQPTKRIPHVDHIVDRVYIGNHRATGYVAQLRRAGIKHILKLYSGEPQFPRDFIVLENPIPDGQFVSRAVLNRGVDFVLKHTEVGHSVLVMCAAGISRSSTFVLAYMLEIGYNIQDAYNILFAQHPEADPHPRLWESLIVHHDLHYSLDDLLSL
ncbi:MAG: dual specificity protein phosphatase family protein [Anaerolineae bacterium]|nr:dual specificity protein phosphatase family protein [Anaerolineae bacterium]